MEPPPLGSILIRRAYDPRDPAMASGNNDDIQNLNAFLGGWSAAVARMAIPSDATLRGSSQGASAVDFQHAACYRAARRLLGILPPEAIAFPLGIDVSQLTRHGVAPTLTIHLRLAATFAPDTIAVGARALDELQQFARASDVTITPLVAFAYLEKADTDARERARGRRDDAARRGATPTARVTTGSSVRQSLARALAWLQRHYGLEVSPTPALARVGQTRSAYTATTITARHGALNTHGNRAGTPGFRPQPIGLPPMPCRCVACHGTLVQSPCTICAGDIGPQLRISAELATARAIDKNPNRMRMRRRPSWMPTVGLEGGTLAFDMLLHMSAAVPRHSTLLRATGSTATSTSLPATPASAYPRVRRRHWREPTAHRDRLEGPVNDRHWDRCDKRSPSAP